MPKSQFDMGNAGLGLFTFALTLATELPDMRADQATGKITLVVRLGRNRAVWFHNIVLALGWLALIAEVAFMSPFLIGVAALIGTPLVTMGLLTSRLSTRGQVTSMERMGLIDAVLVGCVTITLGVGLTLG